MFEWPLAMGAESVVRVFSGTHEVAVPLYRVVKQVFPGKAKDPSALSRAKTSC